MSWPQWSSATQPSVPSVLNPAQPVINSAPAVVPPGLQYTPEQWAQLQQQNWHQWAQWQQQYQQWHQQYGAEYQKSINALAQAQAAQTQLPNVAVPPPLPVETSKPPPPAEEPPTANVPIYTTAPPIVQNYNTTGVPKVGEQRPPLHYPKNNQNQNWPNSNYRYGVEGTQNKRPYEPQQSDQDFNKKPMVSKPNWQNQPPSTQARSANIEELSEAEKKFDKQFAEWEAQFNKWKEQNAEHPDKEQYREYEKKWESWRAQLLERREQMKRKRLGLPVESPNRSKPNPVQNFNSSSQNYSSSQNFNQTQPNYNQPPPGNFTQPPPKVAQNVPPKSGGLLPTPFSKPPPNMNDEPLAFKGNKNISELDANGSDFLKPNTGGGIPGLDLVKDDPEPPVKVKENDVVVLDPEEKEKKGPDFDAISKGINSILGDQKLLNMLSMVSQNQNPKVNDNLTNTVSRIKDGNSGESNSQVQTFPEQSNQSFEEHSTHSETYGQREFVNNFDDQTRSSFTMAHNEDTRFEAPTTFNRTQNQFPERFTNFKGNRFGDSGTQFGKSDFNKEPPNQEKFDRFGGPENRFGLNQDRFGTNQDRFVQNQNRFGINQERMGSTDRFGSGPERFGPNQDRMKPEERFGPNNDRFGRRFPPSQDRRNAGDKFGFNQDRGSSGDSFAPNQERLGLEERFGIPQDRPSLRAGFGSNQNKFGPNEHRGPQNQDRFGFGEDNFGSNQNRFGGNQERFVLLPDEFKPNASENRFPNRNNRSFGPKSGIKRQFGFNNSDYNQRGPEYDDYDYDAVAADFENAEEVNPPSNMEESWPQDGNFTQQNFNDTSVITEPPPPSLSQSDTIFQPTTVIDYEHKSLKSSEPEILIEPIYMFDYRHKPLSRIPLPQRPKWLSETVKNIREFDPPVVRPYEPPTLRRYPPDNWRGDRYQENWPPHRGRSYEDRSFDERRPYERTYDEPRASKSDWNNPRWEEKKSYDEERKSRPIMDFEEEKISDTEWPDDDDQETPTPEYSKFPTLDDKKGIVKNAVLIEDLISPPGRYKRPPRIVIILRGPPGSGKTFLAKLIKDKEVENGGSAPRILSLDDYFMVEQEKEVTEDGKKVKVKEMVYEYEAEMEESYRTSLIKSFKKTITDGYFSFIIVDNVNDKVKYFGEMWSFAKQNGFQVYICQLDLDVHTCSKRNIHGRSEVDIEKCVANWEPTPAHHPLLDATSLLQSASIPEVEMEEVNSPESDVPELDGSEDQVARSKWDNFDCSVDNLAKLDGVNKPLRHRTMEEYLQLDTDWTPIKPSRPGQKTVRWADLEEQKQQEKMRAIGFVVGHTNWDRMMDTTGGSFALTQTKYIEKTGWHKVDKK